MPSKLRSAIIGLGRIGLRGFGTDFPYTHSEAYKLHDRTKIVAVCDTSQVALKASDNFFHGDAGTFDCVEAMLEKAKPEIVSICTRAEGRTDLLNMVSNCPSVKGIWCEKPVTTEEFAGKANLPSRIPIQVNYIRRFESYHQAVRGVALTKDKAQFIAFHVFAKADWDTVPHFADLARFWLVPEDRIFYTPNTGSVTITDYELVLDTCAIRMKEGGAWSEGFLPVQSRVFPPTKKFELASCGVWKPNFMYQALDNLIKVVDGGPALLSPLDSALESEQLARRLKRRIDAWTHPQAQPSKS